MIQSLTFSLPAKAFNGIGLKMVILFWLVVGNSIAQKKNPIIVFSKDYGKGEYQNWVLRENPKCKIISLYHVRKDSITYWLQQASGFLLTGGEDVHPSLYKQASDTSLCGDIDRFRDSLEFQILETAFARKRPLFGICRGEQITNVFLGGSLIVDIPSQIGEKVLHRKGGPTEHEVLVLENSSLAPMAAVKKGVVVTNHHQAIKNLGKGLKPMAITADNIIEAVEKTNELSIPFLMAVQWHPERMEAKNPLSYSLSRAFVAACEKADQ